LIPEPAQTRKKIDFFRNRWAYKNLTEKADAQIGQLLDDPASPVILAELQFELRDDPVMEFTHGMPVGNWLDFVSPKTEKAFETLLIRLNGIEE
jgi:hypothetical protein